MWFSVDRDLHFRFAERQRRVHILQSEEFRQPCLGSAAHLLSLEAVSKPESQTDRSTATVREWPVFDILGRSLMVAVRF